MPHLITGGARSGKSAYAEQLAHAHRGPVCYLATAEVRDDEFRQRVARHRTRRPAHWQVVEVGQGLAETLRQNDQPGTLQLVDCLGMWLMRFFGPDDGFDEVAYLAQRQALLQALAALQGEAVLVSNEIGWGVVPLGTTSRRFVDELGWLNQAVAAVCQQVTLVACGLPLVLKQETR
ncbi:MAG TPA: bifunctional adenosylcobinamide kinase/adenosylcobinamide-phosphate guanylyltransferase [Chromobacteriaceae bacterium]|nr:bifunctional adenosylcobinamide kinase/adenosylcobinamide-phosphate guanylyltransferase [Chromobacteriaceae bacterium]